MVSLPGRSGRRRRVLNEEVLSASSSHVALRAATDNLAVSSSRYGEAAAVENHPQITDFIPRRHRTIAVLVLGGVVFSALAVAGQQFAVQIVGQLHGAAIDPRSVSADTGLAAWLSSVLLVATSAACAIVHSIRRHRVDDVRGRYRVWRWAALACLFASANSVASFHTFAADALGHFAGWTALRDGAVWWLALAGIPSAWLILRTLADVKESRIVAALFLFAMGSYSAAFASFLGFLPAVEPAWEPLVTCAATLLGHWLLLTTVVAYARHVVLDAQGMVPTKRKEADRQPNRRSRGADESPVSKTAGGQLKVEPNRAATSPTLQIHDPGPERDKAPPPIVPAKSQASMKDWVDGRRRERDRYQSDQDDDADDMNDGDRKLTKAERKQLRKLKARNRAA
jgi:hypothetical protein